MKPVKQTQFDPDYKSPESGNCYAACVASILEVGLDKVRNFCSFEGDWQRTTNKWLSNNHGYSLLSIELEENTLPINCLADKTWCLLSGKSPRGDYSHCIVGQYRLEGQGHKVYFVHDPHPDNTMIIGWPTSVDFFIKTNPATIQRDYPYKAG